MSIHIMRSQEKARLKGAFAGNEGNACLWDLSKRELIEIALRMGAILCETTDSYEDALEGDGARERVLDEHRKLANADII